MTGHSYLGNIDPAFPGNSLCDRNSSDPNFQKIYFLITRVSQYCYQQIPGNPVVKIFLQPKFMENLIPYQCTYQ